MSDEPIDETFSRNGSFLYELFKNIWSGAWGENKAVSLCWVESGFVNPTRPQWGLNTMITQFQIIAMILNVSSSIRYYPISCGRFHLGPVWRSAFTALQCQHWQAHSLEMRVKVVQTKVSSDPLWYNIWPLARRRLKFLFLGNLVINKILAWLKINLHRRLG